ncbi:hypothetical protein [Collimonas pratensis]|uniref:Uncharacterized protein n=1 Tax=Collimonas pratensis TaxID=279113 RepID=A0A127QAB9_9BURK|nr:hypothetical protein [Collimonas pratensis]AMP06993.1 hypothetical protein CPter91_4694 [Collimonas pratensis]
MSLHFSSRQRSSAGAAKAAPIAAILPEAGVEATIAALFNPGNAIARFGSVREMADLLHGRLDASTGAGAAAGFATGLHLEFVVRKLNLLFGSNCAVALAALHSLIKARRPLAAKGDAFHLARVLAGSVTGEAALCSLLEVPVRDARPDSSSIRREAEKQALRAANFLIAVAPLDMLVPRNIDESTEFAQRMLPEHERTEIVEPLPTGACRATIPAKAILAAVALARSPGAELLPHLKLAYFAWCNGFHEEGPGTPLDSVKEHFFALSRYTGLVS